MITTTAMTIPQVAKYQLHGARSINRFSIGRETDRIWSGVTNRNGYSPPPPESFSSHPVILPRDPEREREDDDFSKPLYLQSCDERTFERVCVCVLFNLVDRIERLEGVVV